MTVIDDHIGATITDLSDELIFLIASASSPEQRKYTADLFRYFTRQLEVDAYRRGQQSMDIPRLPAPSTDMSAAPEAEAGTSEAPAIHPSDDPSVDMSVSLIPPVRWQD